MIVDLGLIYGLTLNYFLMYLNYRNNTIFNT